MCVFVPFCFWIVAFFLVLFSFPFFCCFSAWNSHSICKKRCGFRFSIGTKHYGVRCENNSKCVSSTWFCCVLLCHVLIFTILIRLKLMNVYICVSISAARTQYYMTHFQASAVEKKWRRRSSKKKTLSSSLPILWLWTLQFMAIQMEMHVQIKWQNGCEMKFGMFKALWI